MYLGNHPCFIDAHVLVFIPLVLVLVLHPMPQFALRQSGIRPPLLRLPDEILDEIASELDLHEDLINFALASHGCANIVIPRHTQYRIIRARNTPYQLWAHLARRADLARNIREVHMCERHNYTAPDRTPTTLIDPQLDMTTSKSPEADRVRNICEALSHMNDLRVFTWSWNPTGQNSKPTLLSAHEDAILDIVRRKSTLKQLGLSGRFGTHVQGSNIDRNSLSYPLWKVSNLTTLCLLGDAWVNPGNIAHVSRLFALSPGLEYLEIPLEFHNLAECRFPRLKKLKLSLQSGATSSIDESRARFLENHPTIEELTWFPIGIPNLAPGSLPVLKRLRTSLQVVIALDQLSQDPATWNGQTCKGTNICEVEELGNQVSPQTITPSMSDPPVLRPLEYLDVRSVDAQTLASFKTFDRMSLRKLRLHMFGDLNSIHQLAEFFPNITWLSLPAVHLPKDAIHPANVKLEEWFAILSLFPNLEVFRGRGLWTAVDSKKDKMHAAIMQLVQLCPKLRELDHCDFYEKRYAWRRIVIIREGEFGERVRYEVRKPPSKDVFDVTDGAFD